MRAFYMNSSRPRSAILSCIGASLVMGAMQNAFAQTPVAPLTTQAIYASDATPTPRQLLWQDMEMYAFVHFTLNTFTGKEWGEGNESPKLFNPTEYDPDQIVGTLAATGFKGVMLTAKHHDGFCLWPTSTTKHSVASSDWKQGKGDVVRDFAVACKKHGVKFGVYLSPWDRNHTDYSKSEYVNVYRKQLEELCTKYGDLFIVWHDGASGGDGYYGGQKESRTVDKSTYYDWPNTWAMVRKWQPKAVIFSDVGPDVRWVGNESGFAGVPCWATYTPLGLDGKNPMPGYCDYQFSAQGNREGKYWMPAEVDVSIRPGWFWHEHENAQVRTPENLMSLYFSSVGRGANLNLNVPPDSRGRLHENDVAALQGFSRLLKQMYSRNFTQGAKVSSPESMAGTDPSTILNDKRESYWMANGKEGEIILEWAEPRTFDVIRMSEPVQLRQRIHSYDVFTRQNGEWRPWQKGESVGMRIVKQGALVTTDAIKIVVRGGGLPPGLCAVSLWLRPALTK